MESIKALSPAQCILLAADLAADADIDSLAAVTTSRTGLFDCELILRILLSCLPEILDPSVYTPYLKQVAGLENRTIQDHAQLDLAAIEQLSHDQARKKLKALHILQLRSASEPTAVEHDPLSSFLIHRSYRIEAETGLLPLLPKLLEPFLDHSSAVRDFYVGAILPLSRVVDGEVSGQPRQTLDAFRALSGYEGISTILSMSIKRGGTSEEETQHFGHGFRSVLAPWIYGHGRWASAENRTKRRKLDEQDVNCSVTTDGPVLTPTEQDGDEWQKTNEWILSSATDNLRTAVHVFEGWAGPQDVDFGPHNVLQEKYELAERERVRLQRNFCQTGFATIYAVGSDDAVTIDNTHNLLVRIAELCEFEPPPELATSVKLLPRIKHHSEALQRALMDFVQYDGLLRPDNPLTVPELETFSLLQMFVYSSYQLLSLGHPLSVVKVAKLRFWSDESEQIRVLQRVIDALVKTSRTQQQWAYVRDTIIWLWDWAIADRADMPQHGHGIFGKIARIALEQKILDTLCRANQFDLVAQTYLYADRPPMTHEEVETAIIDLALQYYDQASNGNRQRGNMKKASDLITAFRSHFPNSKPLQRCTSLIGATHAVSFYSLTLEQGVPFTPDRIRKSEDPVGLLESVMEQNPRSYTELDNLIGVSRSLMEAQQPDRKSDHHAQFTDEDEKASVSTAERRVISMAIEAALKEDDFETAYSYVVNRLTRSAAGHTEQGREPSDDFSWRAAYLAGRQRPRPTNQIMSGHSTSPQVRRLEQRMELLSQSLLLAPSTALPEVLNAWRKCEEELMTVLANENKAEDEFDDRADRHETNLPGTFGDVNQSVTIQPKRKELGRGATEEAPMGLFEVARGAAAAFGRSTTRQTARTSTQSTGNADDPMNTDAPERQRKRDMLANAVTGGMVSGIGWMLGARPTADQDG